MNHINIIKKPRQLPVQKPRMVADPDRALREQLQTEIENRTKPCANPSYECTLTRMDGYEHCFKHILQNPRAPFKQCSFLFTNGRKCTEPAPKHTTKKDIGISTYCLQHSRLSQLNKLRAQVGKFKPIQTPEIILADLSKYVKVDKYGVKEDLTEPACIDPIEEFDVVTGPDTKRSILDYASDSDNDEVPTLFNTARNLEHEDSDNESVDSQPDDPLKHAEIYTTEEAASITKDKLKRLQSLYVDQFDRLQHLLREKRRRYLHDLKREKETLSCVYNQTLDTPQERIMYRKLKAMNHYHRKFGVHAILHKRLQERRARITEGLLQKPAYFNKCVFTEGGVKCGERAIPASKLCRKHITEDKKQVLFRMCGVEKSNIVCKEPVAHIFENSTCVLHMSIPEKRTYVHKKYQDSDDEDVKPEIKHCNEEMETSDLKQEIVELDELQMEGIVASEVTIDPTQHYDTSG